MAKKFKDFIAHEPVHHKTSIGRKPSLQKIYHEMKEKKPDSKGKKLVQNQSNVINVLSPASSKQTGIVTVPSSNAKQPMKDHRRGGLAPPKEKARNRT